MNAGLLSGFGRATRAVGLLRATKSVVHGASSGTPLTTAAAAGGREVLSGALTAGTLKALLTITGAGELFSLGAYTKSVGSRTVRCRVTLDGVVVFDVTTAVANTQGLGVSVVGSDTNTSVPQQKGTLRFNQSCVVEVASSLTETDMLAIAYTAQTY